MTDDYALALRAAVEAQFDVHTRVPALYETRDKAVAAAWRARPGGTRWRDLLAEVNSRLPEKGRLTYGTIREAERNGRAALPAPVEDPCRHPLLYQRNGSHDQMPYCTLCGADLEVPV